MKRLMSLVLAVAILMICAAASADYANATVIDANETRNIKIHLAGENDVPTGYSPTTGRDLDELSILAEGEDVRGMAITGIYYPVMVQHNGICGATGIGAPWYGSYADIYYEMPKSQAGHTRMCMIYNDYHPRFVGGSRSIRVGYLWIRQEWDAPFLFAGMQTGSVSKKWDTNCENEIKRLGIPSSYNSKIPLSQRMLFNGLDGGGKAWLGGKYRVNGVPSSCNLVWDLIYEVNEVLGKDRVFPNHAMKFTDDIPDTDDTANTVYVMFRNDKAATGDEDNPDEIYYFNSMYQYDEDENVYYRSMIRNLENPKDNPVPFVEQIAVDYSTYKKDGVQHLKCTRVPGDDIAFANLIVQYVDEQWPTGECPYPIMTGKGNCEVFMGGKRVKGVWSRDTYNSRTVFYGEDGEEIALQRGRTMIVIMDKDTETREVRYE